MHLLCGEIFNNHFIANFPQSVPVEEFGKSVNTVYLPKTWTKRSGTFLRDTVVRKIIQSENESKEQHFSTAYHNMHIAEPLEMLQHR